MSESKLVRGVVTVNQAFIEPKSHPGVAIYRRLSDRQFVVPSSKFVPIDGIGDLNSCSFIPQRSAHLVWFNSPMFFTFWALITTSCH